jgi:Spy/CpxP family protein refolding chaperone
MNQEFSIKWNMRLLRTGVVIFAIASGSPSIQAQPQNQANQDFPALAGIDLTPQQKDQLGRIRKDSRAQVESILTPEQKSQLKASLQQGSDLKKLRSEINFSPEQESKLKEVQQSARKKVQALLTPEQKQKIRQKALFGGR